MVARRRLRLARVGRMLLDGIHFGVTQVIVVGRELLATSDAEASSCTLLSHDRNVVLWRGIVPPPGTGTDCSHFFTPLNFRVFGLYFWFSVSALFSSCILYDEKIKIKIAADAPSIMRCYLRVNSSLSFIMYLLLL